MGSHPAPPDPRAPILFFDAECGLCTRSVQWCLRHDRRHVLRFAPLQGETFTRLSKGFQLPADLSTAVLADAQGIHLRSDAVLRAAASLGGVWGFFGRAACFIPRPLREAAYRYVAARRIGWFGPAATCPLEPHPADGADRFLR